MLDELTKVIHRDLFQARRGKKKLSPLVCYAAPPQSIHNLDIKKLHAALSSLGPLPNGFAALPASHIPGGPGLFDRLIHVPGYYLTDAENVAVEGARDYLNSYFKKSRIVEFGMGDGSRTLELLRIIGAPLLYSGVDIARGHLVAGREKMLEIMKAGQIQMIEADFLTTKFWKLPFWKKFEDSGIETIGFIPGSTLGNFTVDECAAFLAHASHKLDGLIIGMDSTQDAELIDGAYGAPVAPVALPFYLNGLYFAGRLKRFEVPVDGIESKFDYEAKLNPETQGVEIQLISRVDQRFSYDFGRLTAQISDLHKRASAVTFEKGERIYCIDSFKRNFGTLTDLFHMTGWDIAQRMTFSDAAKNPNLTAKLPFADPAKNSRIDYNFFHLV